MAIKRKSFLLYEVSFHDFLTTATIDMINIFQTLVDTYLWTDWNILGLITSIFLLLALPSFFLELFFKVANQIKLFQLSAELVMSAIDFPRKSFMEFIPIMVGLLCCLQSVSYIYIISYSYYKMQGGKN